MIRTKGVVVGFTPKRIKIKDITRDYYKDENKIGNVKPSNVKKIDWWLNNEPSSWRENMSSELAQILFIMNVSMFLLVQYL